MTISQSQAVWELCRQGFPLTADEAAAHWEQGQIFEPDPKQLRVTREIEQLIEQSNWEVGIPTRAT